MSFFKPIGTLLKKPIPMGYFLFILLLSAGLIYFQYYRNTGNAAQDPIKDSSNCPAAMQVVRLNKNGFTRPLLLSDNPNESDDLNGLKATIADLITSETSKGNLIEASIYVRKLDDGSWMALNGYNGYNPGSLIKVPILITYLKMSESKPNLMKENIRFDQQFTQMPIQEYPDQTITPGRNYSIRELLEAMIVHSDNNATILLIQHMDVDAFKKLFTDIGLPSPPEKDPNFKINAVDISKFIRILYNSTYLNSDNSEIALSLLAKSTFNNGLVSQLPEGVKIAHKFGEQGDAESKQLHEMGIIYAGDHPYLVTVMTRGKEMKNLSSFIGQVSKMVYQRFDQKVIGMALK